MEKGMKKVQGVRYTVQGQWQKLKAHGLGRSAHGKKRISSIDNKNCL
jgi:hypothetical protein